MKMSPLRITFSQDPIKGNQAEQAMILVGIGFSIHGESKEISYNEDTRNCLHPIKKE